MAWNWRIYGQLGIATFSLTSCTNDLHATKLEKEDNLKTLESSFQCGTQLVKFLIHKNKEVELHVNGTVYALQRVLAASGERYVAKTDLSTEFWAKGKRATFMLAGEKMPECHLVTSNK
ncbi:MliC family protein [Candidatus Odyssella thessalonicensis]|uniref:MliC family protein n=1 Tax=Candidatus Odyssella thessalonicensis TaxID=84647 RepID=UPI000225A8CD|nr:MliC family protein [Candidatus Odyssella thessalonicensis]